MVFPNPNNHNATGRILVEKRPPDVPPQTPPQIIALVNRCVSQLKPAEWLDALLVFSGNVTRCPIRDPYQVLPLVFSQTEKMARFAKCPKKSFLHETKIVRKKSSKIPSCLALR